MKPATKRIIIKGTALTLALHGFVVYSQYQEHSSIPPAVWSKLALSFSASMLFIVGVGLLLGSVMKDAKADGRPKKKKPG